MLPEKSTCHLLMQTTRATRNQPCSVKFPGVSHRKPQTRLATQFCWRTWAGPATGGMTFAILGLFPCHRSRRRRRRRLYLPAVEARTVARKARRSEASPLLSSGMGEVRKKSSGTTHGGRRRYRKKRSFLMLGDFSERHRARIRFWIPNTSR